MFDLGGYYNGGLNLKESFHKSSGISSRILLFFEDVIMNHIFFIFIKNTYKDWPQF